MFKKTLTFFLFSLSVLNTPTYASSTDYMTYDWMVDLAADTGISDHVPHWRRLFNTMKVRGFLECGCGYSTAYFMDNAEKVVSVEYINPGYGDRHYREFRLMFADRTNWVPMLYNAELRSNSFNNACAYQCSMHQDYALIDASYVKELFQHYKEIIKKAEAENYPIDAAFVAPNGIFLRGDMVKLLLAHKIPIVAAHHTNCDAGSDENTNLYGWNKVVTPDNYDKIYIPFGQGTTFWISDQLPHVIDSLKKYRDTILHLKTLGFKVEVHNLKAIADDMQ